MTSSLVGSEMCIRDRGNTLCCWSNNRSMPWTPHRDSGMSAKCMKVAAVSYTHLTLPTICSV
eukprot:12552186-Prorocentrum_lima.AAC.1